MRLIRSGPRTGRLDLQWMFGEEPFRECFTNHPADQRARHRQARSVYHRRNEIVNPRRDSEGGRAEAWPFADQDALGPVISAPPETTIAHFFGRLTQKSTRVPIDIQITGAFSER